jgi:Leucine-rich repeat (LRR) protein
MKYFIISLFFIATFISAQWSTDPAAPQSLGSGVQAQVVATSDGGVYVAWLSDGNYHVYLQRMNALGEPQLGDGGMVVSDQPNSSWIAVHHMNLAVDGNDNAIISTLDTRTGIWQVYVYKIAPDGSMPWGTDGLALSVLGSENISPRLTVLSDNSVAVAWCQDYLTVRIQMISESGALQWGDGGIHIEDSTGDLLNPLPLTVDGTNVLLQWNHQTGPFWAPDSKLYLQKYNSSGIELWDSPVVVVGPVVFPTGNYSQESVGDHTGGSFSAWTQMAGSNQSAIAQHISGTGEIVWGNAVEFSTNSSHFRTNPRTSVAVDSSALMAAWTESNGSQSQRGVYAQRLDSSGNRLWGANGTAVVELNSNYDYLDLSVASFGDDLIAAYIEQSVNMTGDIYAARLDADGNYVWTGGAATVTNSGSSKSDMMTGKGPNCLFIAWTENGSVYTHCLREDGTLGPPDVDSADCTADDGTEGVELWDECYSIENTDSLDLSESGLTGEIPPEIVNLTNLTFLDLSQNQLTGAIPTEIGNLINLNWLVLWNNQLTGNIPESIGDLVLLENLDLYYNQLTGEIHTEIGNLTNLEYLYLGKNELTGEIPPEIGNLTNLEHLYLNSSWDGSSGNHLSGQIPSEIGNLVNLTRLSLGGSYLSDIGNQLSGQIPPEIGSLVNLTSLGLHGNQFSGDIPSEIWSMTNLTNINFSENNLFGSIPPEISQLTNLVQIHLAGNNMSGSIPAEIGSVQTLEYLILHSNQFSGEIPHELFTLSNLEALDLAWNQLTGIIPDDICNLNIDWGGNCSGWYCFTIEGNQFCPPYPECIEEYMGEQDTTNCEQVSIIDETLPITYKLNNAFPNPFNPVTTLRYDLPEQSMVNIIIYDMLGRHVKTLVNQTQDAGFKSVIWNATNDYGKPVSAGVYLYQIQAGEFVQTRKMVLLK